MNKKLLLTALTLALSLFSSAPVSAQSFKPSFGITPSTKISKELPGEEASAGKASTAQQPRKNKVLHVGTKTQTDFPLITTGAVAAPTVAAKALPRRANAATTIWGYVASRNNQAGAYGYNSFHPTDPVSFTPLFDDADGSFAYLGENGVQYKNGWLYGVYVYPYSGIYKIFGVDLNNFGNSSIDDHSFDSDYKFIATATAQAVDGTVYGEFWNKASAGEDGGPFEWGTVDYSTMTRTTIGPATHRYVALGITNDDKLYGIDTEANLYSIDIHTGKETLVGSTGKYVMDDYGNFYAQSGAIDHKDNTFYWAAIETDGYSTTETLYEVNLKTAAVTPITTNCGEIVGMLIKDDEPNGNAPAKVADAAMSFPEGSLSGTVSFTLPTKTYNGAALKGTVGYTVKRNGETVSTGSAEAGTAIVVADTVAGAGFYKYSITASNDKGDSQSSSVSGWIGFDTPNAPTNFTATLSNDTATLNWTAPKGSVNGGYTGDITYDISRVANRDTVQVATGISATTFDDDLSHVSRAYYKYFIRARAGELYSARTFARAGVVAGAYVEPAWNEYFDEANEFNSVFTTEDANGDGKKWRLLSGHAVSPNMSTTAKANDDWLFTPPIHLKPGRAYTVTFRTWNYNTSDNSVEVLWGDSATSTAMKDTISATITPPRREASAITVTKDIAPAKEGYYYIGFHENSAAGVRKSYVAIDDISVVVGARLSQPDSVTNLTVTPAALGALSATVSFNVPEKNLDGSSLDAVDSINILRGDSLIATLPGTKAGAAVTYTDSKVPANGFQTYTVVAYTGSEPGRDASRSAYIGIDVPSNTKNLRISDNGANIIASWDRFSTIGGNGGYVDPDKVTFTYYKFAQPNYNITDTLVTSQPGDTSVVININPEETTEADGKTQTFLQLMGRARNEAGWGRFSMLTNELIIGPSIQLPFRETFKNGGNDNGFSWMNANQQVTGNPFASRWRIGYGATHDGDGYGVIWSPYSSNSYNYTITQGDECSYNLPKVALGGVAHPVLYFDIYVTPNDSALLNVQVQTPDRTIHTLQTYDLATFKTYGWQRCRADLTPFANERNVIVRFDGVATGDGPTIGLDDINIFNQFDRNLTVSAFTAPEKVTAGKSYKASVVLKNYGASAATGYSVVLYEGKEPVDTVAVSKSLAVLATDTVALNLPVAPNQESPLSVSAKVVYDGDAYLADNTTDTVSVSVSQSEYLKVNDLGAHDGSAGVELSWTRPAPAKETVTENFDSYEPFAKEMGEWTLVDGDKYLSAGVLQGHMYPGQNTAFAFMAFNPRKLTSEFNVLDANPGITPHSGDQFAAAIFPLNPYSSSLDMRVDQNNWIISPEIPATGQTIKFYAFNAALSATEIYKETFDVLYSTESDDTASFVKIESDVADGNSLMTAGPNWKEFNVAIPAGARYFAIHNNTKAANTFIFGLDDITFDRVIPGSTDSVVAYNIYRDGALIATVSGTDVAYTDAAVMPGSHVYNVTVVYKNRKGETNESGFSNDASVISTGISAIAADANGTYNVYTLDGKAVRLNAKSLKGLRPGAYVINGRKYVVNY